MSGIRSPFFLIILLTYLIAGSLFATLTPAWQAPDEPAHYNYVRYLATQGQFPELVEGCYEQAYLQELTSRKFPLELSVENVCYEYHQPPLYYLLGVPVFLLSNGSLLAVRLLSVLLGAGVVILAYLIGKAIFPHQSNLVYSAMAFVAFVPMHVAILSSVNNDALAEVVFAIVLLLLVRRLNTTAPIGRVSDVLLGAVLGIALITKMTVYIAVPLVGIGLFLASLIEAQSTSKYNWPKLISRFLIVYGIAFLIALPWYGRNALLYGNFDIFGLIRHDEIVVGQLRTADYIGQVGWGGYLYSFVNTTFNSFWGQFGWMAVPMDGRTYQLLWILMIIGICGVATLLTSPKSPDSFSKFSVQQKYSLILMVCAVVLMLSGYIFYNITFLQFQGRYLFPVMIPLGLLFSLGLDRLLMPRWGWGVVTILSLTLLWTIFSSLQNGGLDKWAVLIIGTALIIMTGRVLFRSQWLLPTAWVVIVCFVSLAFLTLISPFWFVIPFLSL